MIARTAVLAAALRKARQGLPQAAMAVNEAAAVALLRQWWARVMRLQGPRPLMHACVHRSRPLGAHISQSGHRTLQSLLSFCACPEGSLQGWLQYQQMLDVML